MPESKISEGTDRTPETEVAPQLPTSGQILGELVKTLGINHPKLQTKSSGTARRYFSGRLEDRVKESSRTEIIKAIADTIADQGVGANTSAGDDTSSASQALAIILDWHAVRWDRLRAFLRPRMMRVFPRHLPDVWRSYVRLAAIDLALRVAAQMRLSGAHPTALDFLDWVQVDRRGKYLDSMRSEVGIPSLWDFSGKVVVDNNTVEAWVYRGSRPSSKNLRNIARVLAKEGEPHERTRILRDLRWLYWASDVAVALGEYIGTEAVTEIVQRLRSYATFVYSYIEDHIDAGVRPAALADILALGAGSRLSEPLLNALADRESDDEWKRDILAAGSGWMRRVLADNYQVHRAEVDALVQKTDGGLLRDWDVSNPEAYAHYQRSMELQMQGRMPEALAEVARAIELDPLDPANHFTLGSVKGGMGAKNGDAAMVNEGLKECWLAAELDPKWMLPWTEIGWILLMAGREREAVEHLRSVTPERGSLDSYYYQAMGAALCQMGKFAESLAAFESALKLNPDDPPVVVATSITGLLAGDQAKSHLYSKMARHMGFAAELEQLSELVKAAKMGSLPDIKEGPDRDIAALDAAVRRNPSNVSAYLFRARAYFEKEDDSRAISDLNAAIWFDSGNAPAHFLRGIVYGYMEQYDRAISDMSEVIRQRPDDAGAHYHRGMAYGERDELDLAIADFDEAIRLEPSHVDAHRGRGDCHLYKREYDRAIADYNYALQLDPEHAPSYFGRGKAYRMKLDFDRAIADYETALRLAPDNSLLYRFRGDAYVAKREFALAIADFDVALSFNSRDEVAYRGRGNAYLFSGNFYAALADYNAAVEIGPNSAVARYGRGVVREVLGDSRGAAEDYRWARELGYDD